MLNRKGQKPLVILLAGNAKKTCYAYNINKDQWAQHGHLPIFHQMMDHCTCVYNNQQVVSISADFGFKPDHYKISFVTKMKDNDSIWDTIAMDQLKI